MEDVPVRVVVAMAGFVGGIIFGATAQRTNFCTMGALSDIVFMGNYTRFRAWLLAIAIATCLILGLGTHLILIQDTKQVDRADRRDLSLFQLGWRWFFRLLALEELDQFKMVFSWRFKLPPAGSQWAW